MGIFPIHCYRSMESITGVDYGTKDAVSNSTIDDYHTFSFSYTHPTSDESYRQIFDDPPQV